MELETRSDRNKQLRLLKALSRAMRRHPSRPCPVRNLSDGTRLPLREVVLILQRLHQRGIVALQTNDGLVPAVRLTALGVKLARLVRPAIASLNAGWRA